MYLIYTMISFLKLLKHLQLYRQFVMQIFLTVQHSIQIWASSARFSPSFAQICPGIPWHTLSICDIDINWLIDCLVIWIFG